jgi:mRNA interferase MazF
MTEGRSVTRGKVVLVPFPFDDLSSTKVRPAVCSSDPVGEHRHVVVAFLTSRLPDAPLDSDLLLQCADPEVQGMGLRVDSTLRLHRLVTLSTEMFRRELGKVSPFLQTQIDDRLRRLFHLESSPRPSETASSPV